MTRTVAAALGPLVAALIRDDPEEVLAGLLRRALPGGPAPAGGAEHIVLEDTGGDADAAVTAAFPAWARLGFRPLRVKPLRRAVPERAALRAVLGTLRRSGFGVAVPQWVVGDALVTLQQPDAIDLRVLSGSVPALAGTARRCGLDLLDEFVAMDDAVRAAVARLGPASSLPFPVAGRYAAALTGIAARAGGDVAARLPAGIEDAPGPRVYFCDPKPANLVLAASAVQRWRRTGSPAPVGVDLDLVYYDSSYVLQAVLATFSAPLPVDAAEFAACRRLAHQACARRDVDARSVDSIVVYHLVRNFATALERADRSKAAVFADALLLADGVLGLGLGAAARDQVRDAARAQAGAGR